MKKLSVKTILSTLIIFVFIISIALLFIPKAETSHATGLIGSGTYADPYLIGTDADLELIPSYDSKLTTTYFYQIANISYSDCNIMQRNDFYGHYRGNSYTITHSGNVDYPGFCRNNYGSIQYLTIYYDGPCTMNYVFSGGVCSKNYGLIYEVEVSSKNRSSITLTLGSYNFGGIAAYNYEGAIICGCEANLFCYTDNYVLGGIAAHNYGEMGWCTSNVIFSQRRMGNYYFGGLVGVNNSTAICQYNTTYFFYVFFTGDENTTATPRIGGFIGLDYGIQICRERNTLTYFIEPAAERYTLSATNLTYVNSSYGQIA